MIWANPIEFFSMGGYGPYVWGSMGAVIIGLSLECFLLRQRRKTALLRTARIRNLRKEATQ